jgi:hypothetical protein
METQMKLRANSVIATQWIGNVFHVNVPEAGFTKQFDITLASQACREQAERHGWEQRIRDAAAMSRDTTTGKSASPQDKFNAMAELIEHYESGAIEWRLAGGGGQSQGGLLLKALMRYQPEKSEDSIRAFLASKDAKFKARLLASDKIRPIADEIRAEAGRGIETDDLLSDFGTEDETAEGESEVDF